ncbi:Transportin-3 [Lamellibrachia satsuma]|nr:Transportin-3 [Lamellibrachia satsuma]
MNGLQQPQLASAAAISLQNICSQCSEHMTNHFSGLLQIVQAIDSFNVPNDVAIRLLKGTVVILSRMAHDKITEGLQQLCSLQANPLNKLMDGEKEVSTSKIIAGSKEDPTNWIDRLAIIFRHTNPTVTNGQTHPCQPVVQEVWPTLSKTCDRYQADVRIIERCCRCIRFAVRCVGKASVTLLTPLVMQMVNLYETHKHSCFLYLGSILVDEYGSEASCVQGLLGMLQAFCVPAFKQLEEHSGLKNHPDTVDDFFRLCLRFTQRTPVALLQCPVMKSILCCGIAACSLDHREANASVTKFLSELIKTASMKEDKEDFETRRCLVEALLLEHGQLLVTALINACVFSLPSYLLADSAEVIYALMLLDRPAVCKWLEVALKGLPMENSGGAVTATHKQLTDFHKAVTSAEEIKQVSRAIREFQRLFSQQLTTQLWHLLTTEQQQPAVDHTALAFADHGAIAASS